MFRFGLIAVIALAIAMAATNPGHEVHKKVVYSAIAADVGNSQVLGDLAGGVLSNLDPISYHYHNYIVFSTMTRQNEVVSVGALNRVWKNQ